MSPNDRRMLAAGVLSLAAAILPELDKRRARRIMDAHRLGRQQGIIEGANAMFQDLSPRLRGRAHEQAYQAFWRVYDKRETL